MTCNKNTKTSLLVAVNNQNVYVFVSYGFKYGETVTKITRNIDLTFGKC